MTDISKCSGGCDKQDSYHRWTCTAGMRQSYADFKPDEDGECEGFWDNEGYRQELSK